MEFDISGAKIFARIPTGIPILGDILITETIVVSWIVMLIITGLCIFLTRNLKVEKNLKTAGGRGNDRGSGYQPGKEQYGRYKV